MVQKIDEGFLVHVEKIPLGYGYRVTEAIKSNPHLSAEEAVETFVDAKYGAWCAKNLTGTYRIEMQGPSAFNVVFEREDEAEMFESLVGGR